MENRLKALMDFQKFDENANLQQVINSVHSRYAVKELSLDEMEWVAAAGVPQGNPARKNGSSLQDADRKS